MHFVVRRCVWGGTAHRFARVGRAVRSDPSQSRVLVARRTGIATTHGGAPWARDRGDAASSATAGAGTVQWAPSSAPAPAPWATAVDRRVHGGIELGDRGVGIHEPLRGLALGVGQLLGVGAPGPSRKSRTAPTAVKSRRSEKAAATAVARSTSEGAAAPAISSERAACSTRSWVVGQSNSAGELADAVPSRSRTPRASVSAPSTAGVHATIAVLLALRREATRSPRATANSTTTSTTSSHSPVEGLVDPDGVVVVVAGVVVVDVGKLVVVEVLVVVVDVVLVDSAPVVVVTSDDVGASGVEVAVGAAAPEVPPVPTTPREIAVSTDRAHSDARCTRGRVAGPRTALPRRRRFQLRIYAAQSARSRTVPERTVRVGIARLATNVWHDGAVMCRPTAPVTPTR